MKRRHTPAEIFARRKVILDQSTLGRVDMVELAERFHVGKQTIRWDIAVLRSQGHGVIVLGKGEARRKMISKQRAAGRLPVERLFSHCNTCLRPFDVDQNGAVDMEAMAEHKREHYYSGSGNVPARQPGISRGGENPHYEAINQSAVAGSSDRRPSPGARQ